MVGRDLHVPLVLFGEKTTCVSTCVTRAVIFFVCLDILSYIPTLMRFQVSVELVFYCVFVFSFFILFLHIVFEILICYKFVAFEIVIRFIFSFVLFNYCVLDFFMTMLKCLYYVIVSTSLIWWYDNHVHNILKLFDLLPNFPFTISETKRDY